MRSGHGEYRKINSHTDLSETEKLADTPAAAAKTHVEIDGLASTAMAEYLGAHLAYSKWKRSKSERDRKAAVETVEAAAAKMRMIVERAPCMKLWKERLDKRWFAEVIKDG